jgi:type II secretory pathway pseudopilin PulG
MIAKSKYTGQLINNTNGFSMIETLIVAGILGALSLFAMEMLERQNKMLKTVEAKFALQSIHTQITQVVANGTNCFATFNDVNIKPLLLSPKENPEGIFPHLQKEYESITDNEVDSEFKPIFHTKESDPKAKYEGITIEKYTLSLREDNFIEEESLSATISLDIHYDLGRNILGGRYRRKSLNLSLNFSEEDPSLLTSCHSSNSSTNKGSNLVIIDPLSETEYSNLTGQEACQNLGKTCLQVISQNYASKAYGQIGIGNLCQINYNQPLTGVEQGSPISNIHSCEAKLGQFETYKIEQTAFGVTCQGIFKAQCQ